MDVNLDTLSLVFVFNGYNVVTTKGGPHLFFPDDESLSLPKLKEPIKKMKTDNKPHLVEMTFEGNKGTALPIRLIGNALGKDERFIAATKG